MIYDLNQFIKIRALVIGDLILDEYLWGRVERISPEAPVPVVVVERETHTLGGAGNVINNLKAMHAQVSAAGIIGADTAGNTILEMLKTLGVETSGIITEIDRPTTRKIRVIASNQQVLRIDKELGHPISDLTLKGIMAIVEKKISDSDLIIISDYDKGVVTRKFVANIVNSVKKKKIPLLVDPKSLDFTKYAGVYLLTPNRKEAELAVGMDIHGSDDLSKAGKMIMDQAKLNRLIITCGKDGMALFERNKPYKMIASQARQVFDVSGAGDTVISFLGLGLAAGLSFSESAVIANAAAGIVVAKIGTATPSLNELERSLTELDQVQLNE